MVMVISHILIYYILFKHIVMQIYVSIYFLYKNV